MEIDFKNAINCEHCHNINLQLETYGLPYCTSCLKTRLQEAEGNFDGQRENRV